uniref:Thyroglobulin type-1 domain-containing protein n=1 Tax=Syphacia muris TaxID=451379 RepID=A0A0N5AC21_9BILA
MSVQNGLPRKCDINYQKDQCPTDFVCAPSGKNRNFCCSLEQSLCPAGQIPYYHPLTSKTVKCKPSSIVSNCPSGYACSVSVTGAVWGFCCSQQVAAECPRNSVAYLNPLSKQPKKCFIGITSCRKGFECKNQNLKTSTGFCCSVSPRNMELVRATTTDFHVFNGDVSESSFVNLDNNAPTVYRHRLSAPPVKEPRIVDIQKEVDRNNVILDKKLKSALLYGRNRLDINNGIQCPRGYKKPFLNSRYVIECHMFKKCPGNLQCVSPQPGYMSKSICCKRLEKSDDESFKTTRIFSRQRLSETADPFCPVVIEDRYCKPGDATSCEEAGFFCQFNVVREAFMCCTMAEHLSKTGNKP